jgi:hypothetical protein
MTKRATAAAAIPSPLDFFGQLRWLDGRPLMATIEEYRRQLFLDALFTFRADGTPAINLVLSGRAKKNWKTADLVLAGLYRLLIWPSPAGNDGFILANDEGQAGDDLSLAKKLVSVNADQLGGEVEVLAKAIRRCDGAGSLQILPARDAVGAHGKTALFLGFDEIHGMRSWDLFEALAPDPTRPDVLQWITSYDGIYNAPGVPLYDLKQSAQRGDDPRMLFSWYSGGDICTDPAFADLSPEERANPSMGSWPEGRAYLDQQRRRLPTHKFRRLHLNLPGAPDGAFFDADAVLAAVVVGRQSLPPQPGRAYRAFVDMSGGSSDDACLSIAHEADGRAIVDLVMKQAGKPPFNPRAAVLRFANVLRDYGLSKVTGDAYAGQTFRTDFEAEGIAYVVARRTKTDLYEALEPRLNARDVELPDVAILQEQLLTLVTRGSKVDHQAGDHDDFANACAGAVDLILARPVADVDLEGLVAPMLVQIDRGSDADGGWEIRPSLTTETSELIFG